jgi:ribonuclease HII
MTRGKLNPHTFDHRLSLGLVPEDNSSPLPGLSFISTTERALILAGVDEAGRGPLAGPVVAAAVVFNDGVEIKGLNDSKALTAEQREIFFVEIQRNAKSFAISIVPPSIIDSVNILQAAMRAMRDAISRLTIRPDLVLVDGNQRPGSGLPERAIIKGDQKSASVMAAGILAKVTRDRIMVDLHRLYPAYGFDEHKGYGCPQHLKALKTHGASPIHRRSFAPVRSVAGETTSI